LLVNYGYIGLFILAAIAFTIVMLLLPAIFRLIGINPRKPNPIKNATYECGMETIGRSWVQFNFRYYFYALMFIALDVMVVFVYPWAAELRKLGYFGLIAVLVFVFIVVVGYMYAWRKRVLEWK
jgi:NADH-quinone oxidoreductase subunit A